MRATAILCWASALLASAGCGGSGGGGGTAVVEEPRASGASVAAALRVADALAELAGDPVTVVRLDTTGGTVCERGSLRGICVRRRRDNVVHLVARHCAVRDAASGALVTVHGRISVSAASEFCGLGGSIPPEIPRTYRFTGVRAEVVDATGVAETFTAGRLVETVRSLRSGCDLSDALLELDGALTVERRGRDPLALRASRLRLERRATGPAGQCARAVTASGRLAVGDSAAGATTVARLDAFTVALDADGATRRVAGGVALPCTRSFTVVTDEPLTAGDGCPGAGRLALERNDGSRGVARFAAGAAEIDADGDGAADLVADCRALPRCGG